MHSLLCWYCMRLSCLYYVIWTFHVLSLYIMFLSHLLFLCVAVYLSRLLSSLTISSLFFSSNCNFNYERESVRNTCQTISYRQIVFRLPSYIHHTHPIDTTNRGEFVTVILCNSADCRYRSSSPINIQANITSVSVGSG